MHKATAKYDKPYRKPAKGNKCSGGTSQSSSKG